LTLGLALLVVTLALRSAIRSRHVRGRLFTSGIVFALYAVAAAVHDYGSASAAFRSQIVGGAQLLLYFGVVNAVVALALNPWRLDGPSERFPAIVQDSVTIALVALIAAIVLQERVWTATAAGAVVIGFALQDTLGNLFAGLAIQIEKPFRVGHWVQVAGTDGLVTEITWRATKIRTRAGNFVVVPNSSLARDTITNYSEPTAHTRIVIDVGVSYDAAPNEVKAVILDAIRDEPLLCGDRQPEVLMADFAASSILYRVHVWTSEPGAEERIHDRVRSAVYYAFRRHRIEIPYPIQIEMSREEAAPAADPSGADRALARVPVFAALLAEQRAALSRGVRSAVYAAGERVMRQGEPGTSMFVVTRGEAVVVIEPGGQEVARHGPGGFFGEMSLLTGDPRSATVKAVTDLELLEITVDGFREFVLANPSALEVVAAAVSTRAAELAAKRTAGPAVVAEPPQTFLARVRRFLART
jgi:small-conductance mechanosensitive channel/CRP-like cAMP-binding protein